MIEPVPSARPMRSRIGRVFQAVPTLAVLAVLGAIGWWGHHTGWKLPKFAEVRGEVDEVDDWCGDHGVPEQECVECHPELLPRPTEKGWCKVHGIPECVLCNPELAQLKSLPTVSPAERDRAKIALDFSPRPENNPICKTHRRRIQLADEAAADKAGIAVQPVWTAPAVEFVAAPGEIGYDQTRVAHLSSRSPGSVTKVFKRLGDSVKQGDLLALVDAGEVGKAKTELLQAFGLLELKTQTLASIRGAVPEARIREVEAGVKETEIRLDAARQGLVNLGLPITAEELKAVNLEQLKAKLHFLAIPAAVAQTLDPVKSTSNLLPLVAPWDGVILSRDVVSGEVVATTNILFEIVDTRFLWLTFDVKGEDARRIKAGQTVRFKPDGSPEELTGKLAWISTQADPKSRTVKVRANLADPDGQQRANTFGSGRVILREEPEVVSVPNDAIQSEGDCQIVFVRDKDYLREGAPKVFHVRKIRTAAKDEAKTEVVGVLPGELIVTKGAGLLLTQLLRDNLGDNCECHSKK